MINNGIKTSAFNAGNSNSCSSAIYLSATLVPAYLPFSNLHPSVKSISSLCNGHFHSLIASVILRYKGGLR